MKKQRGQHGATKTRQGISRAIGRRLNLTHDGIWPRREELARMAQDNRQRWPVRAYLYYRYLMKNGLPGAANTVIRLDFDVPDEISNLPAVRRRRLNPYDVAVWAYRHRHQQVSWTKFEVELAYEAQSLKEGARKKTPGIKAHLAKLRAGPQTDKALDEISYQEALLEFVSGPLRHDWQPPSADAIRKAVERNALIWRLAEQAAADAS